MKKSYSKPPISIQDQISRLQDRGMQISDTSTAEHFLTNISYYRLAGYWWELQTNKKDHQFKEGTTFDDVITRYNFDRELRILLFDAIERIEIGVRTRMVYTLSMSHGAWWFEDDSLVKNHTHFITNIADIDKELRQSKEEFIQHHDNSYSSPSRPPAWKTIEVVSLGLLSKLYSNLKDGSEKKEIARSLHLPNHEYLQSWLTALVVLRNHCAHHSRIWNRVFSFPPRTMATAPGERNWVKIVPGGWMRERLYYQLLYVKYLLDVISPDSSFSSKVTTLLGKYPSIPQNEMGIPSSWSAEKLWST